MKRLSLEELKAQKAKVVNSLETIKGGAEQSGCHWCPPPKGWYE